VRFVLDRTPFYAEGGGQVGDTGVVRTPTASIRVTDTKPGPGGTIVHHGVVGSGEVRTGDEAAAEVDAERRASTARSHTATHVVHHTLRNLVGEHARQAGSLVAPGRLRFDFTHHSAVPRETLEEAEYLANRRLSEDSPVRAYETTFDFARNEGAIALFGEKYGDIVRVVEVGDYSIELCGGTHVHHTGEVALIRLLHEASIGSGFRRIEALVGPDALKQVNVERRLLEEVTEAIGGGDPAGAPERVRKALNRIKELESELGKLRKAEQTVEVERLAASAQRVDGASLVVAPMPERDADALREMAIALRSRLEREGAGAAILGTADGSRALLVAACTKELVSRGVAAADLLKDAAAAIGGGAGGKPNLAFAGGSKAEALGDALGGIPARLAMLLAGA
jgi:alanyl-tRNA synthetase